MLTKDEALSSSYLKENANIPTVIPTLQSLYEEATKENTRKSYQSDIRCFQKIIPELPCTEADVLHYVQQRATELNPNSLQRHILSVRRWHVTQAVSAA